MTILINIHTNTAIINKLSLFTQCEAKGSIMTFSPNKLCTDRLIITANVHHLSSGLEKLLGFCCGCILGERKKKTFWARSLLNASTPTSLKIINDQTLCLDMSKPVLPNAGIRLHDIFVFHDGHHVRLGDRSAINACPVFV